MTASFHLKKTRQNWPFLIAFLSTQNVNLARFARSFVKWDLFVIFKHHVLIIQLTQTFVPSMIQRKEWGKISFFPQWAVSESDRVLAFQIVVSDRRASIEDHDLGSTNTSSSDTTRSSLISWNCCYPRNQVSNEESRLNHLYEHQTRIPDIEVNSTQSSVNFLNSSGGSLLLSDAIREARRTR